MDNENSNTSLADEFIQQLKNTAVFYKFAGNFLAIPFTCKLSPAGKCRLVSLSNTQQLLGYYFVVVWIIILTTFLWVDLLYQFKNYMNSNQFVPLIMHLNYCFAWLTASCMTLDYFVNWKSKVEAFNLLIEFIEDSIRTDPGNESHYTKYWGIYDKAIPFLTLGAFSGSFFFSLLVLIFPEQRNCWWFLIIPPEAFHPLVRSLFCLVEFTQMVYPWVAFVSYFHQLCFYLVCLANGLNLLIINRECTVSERPGPSCYVDELKHQRMYNKIQLLGSKYNEAFGSLLGIAGMKICCTVFGILVLCIITLTAKRVNPIVTVTLVIAVTSIIILVATVLPLAGNVNEKSMKFKSKSKSPVKKETRIIASCKPLAINVGSFYPIKKINTLTYFSLFTEHLVNLLIGLRNLT